MTDTVPEIAFLQLDPLFIDVPEGRLRDVDPEKVKQFAVSMRDVGQITAIEVIPGQKAGRWTLNAGAHRLAAAIEAKLPFVIATVFEGTADQRRLREIDENLYRAELTPYDQAAFLAERRAIYERINDSPRRHGRSKAGTRDNLSPKKQLSFFDDVTERFGIGRKTVIRALKRKGLISAEVWHRLRGHPVSKIASELDKLARLNDAEQRRVVRLLMQEVRPAKNVSAALRALSDEPIENDDDRRYRQLTALWGKASPKVKADFLAFAAKREKAA